MSREWELLYNAMRIFIGKGTCRERLSSAWEQQLNYLGKKNLPEEKEEFFVQLSNEVRRGKAVDNESLYKATIQSMSDDCVQAQMEGIISIYVAVCIRDQI